MDTESHTDGVAGLIGSARNTTRRAHKAPGGDPPLLSHLPSATSGKPLIRLTFSMQSETSDANCTLVAVCARAGQQALCSGVGSLCALET